MGARKVGSAQLAGARVVGQRLLAVLDLLRAIIVELWLRGGGGAVRGGTPREGGGGEGGGGDGGGGTGGG